MSLILHLSDLHLSEINDDQVTGDYKLKGLVPLAQRQNRMLLLRTSLAALDRFLTAGGETLDAVVITGDVSLKHATSGFAAIEQTLGALGSSRPPNERIVIVPGNHDVLHGSPPSSAERYEAFVGYTRPNRYVTPYLEGLDISVDPAASGTLEGTGVDPVLDLGDSLVVAMNSTDLCASVTNLSVDAVDLLTRLAGGRGRDKGVAAELEALRSNDIARISEAQFIALRGRLQAFLPPSLGGPTRILAVHHQLLPVTTDEEFKPFETITNLGQLREFAAAQEIAVILHGHKHHSATYVDTVIRGPIGARKWTQILVSSCATVWRQATADNEFARLVAIPHTYPRCRRVAIESVPATDSAGELGTLTRVMDWIEPPRSAGPPIIAGETIDAVYDHLMVILEREAGEDLSNVVCTILDGQTAERLPDSYPEIDGVEDKAAWLAEIVGWWQKEEAGVGRRVRRFNHGERIRNYQNRINQINSVVHALSRDNDTTRGIVQIIDQTRDDLSDVDQRFPSFASVHFIVDIATKRLNCIGYFRKQQLRMWWPVNVAEIAALQKEVLRQLNSNSDVDLVAGSITTFSAVGVDGTNRPRLIVPEMDRVAQDSPDQLWAAAYDLFDLGGEEVEKRFLRLFEDWQPSGKVERDGTAVSLVGLDVLSDAVGLFAARNDSAYGGQLSQELHSLCQRNATYAASEDRHQEPSQRQIEYESWSDEVHAYMNRIRVLVAAITNRNDAE